MTTLGDPEYSLDQMRDKWAAEIGRFVMAFGSIEGHTYTALRYLPQDPTAKPLVAANLPLGTRIDLLVGIAGGHRGGEWQRFIDTLLKIKELSKNRNLVAHNGVGASVYVNAAGEYLVQEEIFNAKKLPLQEHKQTANDRVKFKELVEHRKQAEALDRRLMELTVEVLHEVQVARNAQQRA